LPADEAERLAALRSTKLLDSPPVERFDRFTRIARRLFGVPIALVSLVDAERQWFKSRQGLDVSETPRDISFCGHAILGGDVLVVPDATRDPRFRDNPLVTGDPNVRFYAGYPLRGPDGYRVGTLCVIDRSPRELSTDEIELLRDLGAMIEAEIGALALATTDPLTGISNRLGFEAIAGKCLARCRRDGSNATLMSFDLDGFKRINDLLGHAAGDASLQRFAAALLAVSREADVVARLGGDEFCLLLLDSDTDGAARVESRLRSWLAEIATDAKTPRIEFSAGAVAFDPSLHASLADLAHDADQLMYQHKARRRDRPGEASVPGDVPATARSA